MKDIVGERKRMRESGEGGRGEERDLQKIKRPVIIINIYKKNESKPPYYNSYIITYQCMKQHLRTKLKMSVVFRDTL